MWSAWKCQAIVGAQSLQETEVSCETIQLQGIPGNGSKSVTSAKQNIQHSPLKTVLYSSNANANIWPDYLPNIHPTDQMSTGVESWVASSRTSGALYQRVTIWNTNHEICSIIRWWCMTRRVPGTESVAAVRCCLHGEYKNWNTNLMSV
jgi:hypothetical protein